MNMTAVWIASSLRVKPGSRNQTTQQAVAAYVIFTAEKFVTAFCWKLYDGIVLKLRRAYPSNIFLEPGTSVTRTKYCDMLRNEMIRAICMKWRGRLSDVSLHDNVPPRMAAHTINIFQKLNWKVIEHSAYSFHLAVSISLGILKYAPLAYWLANDDKVK